LKQIRQNFYRKQKISLNSKKSAAGKSVRKNLIRKEKSMKNNYQNLEITSDDFNSLFSWKVFWKMIRHRRLFVLCLKAIFLAIVFAVLMFSGILPATCSIQKEKIKSGEQPTSRKAKNNSNTKREQAKIDSAK
jgi:hypothetical protein